MDSVGLAIVFLVLGLILGFPLSILANINTPRIQAFFNQRAISVRGRKVSQILQEYKDVRTIKNSFPDATLRMFLTLLTGLSAIPTLILLGVAILFDTTGQKGFYPLVNALGALFMMASTFYTKTLLDKVGEQLRRCLNFTK